MPFVRVILSQMFINQIHEGVHVIISGEDGTGCSSTAAAFAAVNGSIFFYKLAAVRFAGGAEEHGVAWTVNQEEHLRNVVEEFLGQIQQVIYRENFIVEGQVGRFASFTAGSLLIGLDGLTDAVSLG